MGGNGHRDGNDYTLSLRGDLRTETAVEAPLQRTRWYTTSVDGHDEPDGHEPGRPRLHRDPIAWGIGSLALLLSAMFFLTNLIYNQGNIIPPLDDTYIHLQYAKQIGQGHFFEYNTGDPISAGASSLLYVLVLGACYALGVQGSLFLPFVMAFGTVLFTLTAVGVYVLGCRMMDRRVGAWSGALVATSGPLLWGATSGMEICFVAFLLMTTTVVFTMEAPRRFFVFTPLIGVLTALSRPEALIYMIVLCAVMTWTVLGVRPFGWLRALGGLALIGLPMLAGLGQLLFYEITTGTTAANGVQAKSLLYEPLFYPTEVLDKTLTRFRDFVVVLNGLNSQDYFFPAALFLAFLGAAYLIRERVAWRPLACGLSVAMLLVLLAISTLKNAHAHHLRYIQPLMPLIILLAVIGIAALSRLFAVPRSRRLVFHTGIAIALFFTVVETPAWGIRLGQQAAGVRDQPVSISNWAKGHLPPGSSVAVNDVGAAAYFSDHYIVDLIGLGTNGLAIPTVHGSGALYEKLRAMPEDKRPDYFSVFENWSVHQLKDAGLFDPQTVAVFDIKSPEFSYQTAGAAYSCQASRFCNTVRVYKADWSLAGTGDRPVLTAPGRIRDYVNVSDLDSERRHGYQVVPVHEGFQPWTSVRSVDYPDGRTVADSGRHVIGGERVTARNLEPGKPVTITSRVDVLEPMRDLYTGSREVLVKANGRVLGKWAFQEAPQGWYESTFTVPGDVVTGDTLTVEFGPVQEFLGPYPDYTSYGYWFSQ